MVRQRHRSRASSEWPKTTSHQINGRVLPAGRARPVSFDPDGRVRPVHAPSARMTGFASVPIPSMVMRTSSPASRWKSSGGTIPVPVRRITPFGESIVPAEPVDQLLEPPGHPGDGGLPVNRSRRPPRSISRRMPISARGGMAPASVIDGPECTAGVVDLGLRQIERVLALDVPGADIVADREADQLQRGAQDQSQLGLGHRPARVAADANRLARARRPGWESP